MAITNIPLRNDTSSFDFDITLENVPYNFLLVYNQREDRWYMSIRTVSGDQILNGIPVMVVWPMVARFKDERLPPGILFSASLDTPAVDPTRYDLEKSVLLFYQESDG